MLCQTVINSISTPQKMWWKIVDVAKLHDCQKNIIDPNLSKSRQLTDVSINNSVFDFCRVE